MMALVSNARALNSKENAMTTTHDMPEYREGVTGDHDLETKRNTLFLLAVLERNAAILGDVIDNDPATDELVHEQGRGTRV
jgi:hypothetical protein